MEVIVDGTTYRIQFEHTHKNTKTGRDKLGAFRDLRGVTQCVLVTDRLVIPTFAICSALDNFFAGRRTKDGATACVETPASPVAARSSYTVGV